MNLRLESNPLAKLNQLNGKNESCSDLWDEWVCVKDSLLTYVTHFVRVCGVLGQITLFEMVKQSRDRTLIEAFCAKAVSLAIYYNIILKSDREYNNINIYWCYSPAIKTKKKHKYNTHSHNKIFNRNSISVDVVNGFGMRVLIPSAYERCLHMRNAHNCAVRTSNVEITSLNTCTHLQSIPIPICVYSGQ